MFGAIVSALMPLIIRMVLGYLGKQADKKAAREAFLKFVDQWERTRKTSVTLHDSDREQVDDIRRQQLEWEKQQKAKENEIQT